MDPYADISGQAASLHRRALVFDAHADTLTEMTDRGYDLDQGLEGTHLDLPRCADGVLDAQVLTCFVSPKFMSPGAASPRAEGAAFEHSKSPRDGSAQRVRALLDTMDRQLACFPDRLALCLEPGDVQAARAAGKLAGVLAIEGGHAIEDDLDLLREFRARGVRSMTLTWNNSNGWADGCGDDGPHGGLTHLGREVVVTMEQLGMLVDVSHVAESTFADVLDVARGPLVASHSCARALREHVRNLHDDQLRAIAQVGGVACVNFYPGFLVSEGAASLADVLDHIDRFVEVAGAEHVGLGGDFDGIPAGPVGLEDVSALPRLTAGMLERGHDESVVEGILGSNLLRVFDGAILDARATPDTSDQGAAT